MAKKKKAKISKQRDKDIPKIENLVAKFANQFNQCKVIDVDKKKYNRKNKHKEVYSDMKKITSEYISKITMVTVV